MLDRSPRGRFTVILRLEKKNNMDAARTRRTYQAELVRAAASGVLETSWNTFLLLIAVRAFDAGPLTKSLVASGSGLGLLLTPITVSLVARARWPGARAAAAFTAVGAVLFWIAAVFPALPVFVAVAMLAPAAHAAMVPLITQMYQENYPEHERGKRFSRTVMIRVLAAAGFGWLGGHWFRESMAPFPSLLGVYGLAYGLATAALLSCPSAPLSQDGGSHPLRALRHVRTDRLFRITLWSWMFMGFGNLLMMPLRVEYLANPKYGLTLTAPEVALLTVVIPSATRLVMAPIWGWMFDRINFFLLRVLLNLGFLSGIVSFFWSGSWTGLTVGSVLFGVANAGGDVAWSLWVTKIAAPEKVADYMSVHTFLTGARSLVAPFVAFHLAVFVSLQGMAAFSGALIVLASALLLPEFRHGRTGRLQDLGVVPTTDTARD